MVKVPFVLCKQRWDERLTFLKWSVSMTRGKREIEVYCHDRNETRTWTTAVHRMPNASAVPAEACAYAGGRQA